MVRYQGARGAAVTQRDARGKHFILFDLPGDKGAELKRKQPNLGWATDKEGHASLPYSVGARLIMQTYAERTGRGTPLFDEFPTSQLLARLWSSVIPFLDLGADNIFKAVREAASQVANKDSLVGVAGDWFSCQGDIDGEGHARWITSITRGDAFGADPTTPHPGLVGANIFYYVGPYMLEEQREDERHFIVAANTLGKLFMSDDDDSLCDSAQLAEDVCVGLADSEWPDLLSAVSNAPDATDDVAARGGQRIMELRNRVGYYQARLKQDGEATQYIVRLLPSVMRRSTMLPSLAAVFSGVMSGSSIAEGVMGLADALSMAAKQVDDRMLGVLERALTPLGRILSGPAFTSLSAAERLASVVDKIEATKLSVKAAGATASSQPEAAGDTKVASGKLLLSQLTQPDALDLLQQLATYRSSAEFDPVTYLEWAHSGRWPPEMRAARLLLAEKLPNVSTAEQTARRDALLAVSANDMLSPVGSLMQLAWGHVKTLEGYPELQDVYDLGQTRMADVIGRLCARALSADGASVPPALRFARATKLTAALRARAWGQDVDFCSDGDACMLSYIEGGSGNEYERVPAERVYTDISQVLRVRRVGTNVLAFFGVHDSPTHSWRQAVSSCEHAFQGVAASNGTKRERLGKAMQRFLTRALDDVGVLIPGGATGWFNAEMIDAVIR